LKLFVYAGILMETMRDAWTDARLDDLNVRVREISRRMDDGFNQTHADIRSLRSETRTEIAALHRLVLQVGAGVVAAQTAGVLGLIAALS
jgi:hypothetical protein